MFAGGGGVALLRMKNGGNVSVRDKAQRQEQTITELKKAFSDIRDKTLLCREFFFSKPELGEFAI